jgi:hypothetical protein
MAGTKNLDATMLARLVALLDSSNEREAENAFRHIRLALQKDGTKFYEAIEAPEYKKAAWEAFGQPGCLRPYFETATGQQDEQRAEILRERELRAHAERTAAESARAHSAADAALRADIDAIRAHATGAPRGPSSAFDAGDAWRVWQAVIGLLALVLVLSAGSC